MDPICELQERAWAARERRENAAAERHLRRALDVLERRGEGSHPDAANLASELADLLVALRRDAEAESLARRALRLIEAALAESARGADLEPEGVEALERIRLGALGGLATALRGQGRYAEAEPFARQALRRCARLFGARSFETAARLNDLGVLYKYWGKYERAARAYARARTILESGLESGFESGAPDDATLGTLLYNLAGLAHARGEHAAAEPLVRSALERLERALGTEHPDVGAGHATLGAILQGEGRLDEAQRAYGEALRIVEQAYGGEHPDVALVLSNLAEGERARGRLERAEELAREALRLRRVALGDEHPHVATSLNNLAIVLAERGRLAAARRLVRQALSVCAARRGERHPTARILAQNLAALEARTDAAGEPR